MALCPKDFKPCCDDVCYGAGCILMGGMPMYQRCQGCGEYVAIDGSDNDDCVCEPDYEEFDEEELPS